MPNQFLNLVNSLNKASIKKGFYLLLYILKWLWIDNFARANRKNYSVFFSDL